MAARPCARLIAGAAFAALPVPAVAQPVYTLPPVQVIGVTPLAGTGIDVDKVPGNVQSLTSSELTREGSASVLDAMTDRLNGVSVNANLADPFQPDILYRGFEASPVLGTPQGIAVYQNGVRVNEAFGDTVDWDLIPDLAIDRVDVLGSNPVYGLNALGGAVVVTMKNGFTHHGGEAELTGGSFARRGASFQYGAEAGNFAAYVAGRALDQDGWRQFSPDSLRQLYADLAARGERASLDLSFTGANNRLFGQGVTPIQELAAGRSLVFTTPQDNFNQLEFVTLNGAYRASDTLSLQGNLYRREFRQTVANGNTTGLVACAPANGLLCQSDAATPATGAGGAALPDISAGGTLPIGENDREFIRAVGLGGAAQAADTAPLFGHDNNFVAGGSIDHAAIDLQSTTEVGVIDPALQVLSSGLFVATPENTGFNATPVRLNAKNDYYGLFATDTFDVTPSVAVTASGRYNLARIALQDLQGTSLSGGNRYSRFNPAIGATWKLAPAATVYAGYSEANRVPTPSEIECSNPAQPCLLPSSLASDPPALKQVVSHTIEAGIRGTFAMPERLPGAFAWNLGLYRTELDDDIYGVASSVSAGFFQNIGATRRQGIEASLAYKDERWSVYATYSLVDATFQSSLTLPSPNNPFADANGNIQVRPGDRLPGIPQHQIKAGVDYRVAPGWIVGAALTFMGPQYLRGDEANRDGQLPGYAVVNLHSSYSFDERIELFADIRNLLDSRYATFGQYGDPTGVGAPGIPAGAATNAPGIDNRFVSPAPPVSVFGGVRVRF
ncbi:MAG TPA: TonB-dependent receptor [Stellaceae bacterium]|nr:TonB-dependent receptor [Stellaceae bacterium]